MSQNDVQLESYLTNNSCPVRYCAFNKNYRAVEPEDRIM